LVANVPGEIATRLRLLATLQRRPANHVLTELLARELPTSGQLAGPEAADERERGPSMSRQTTTWEYFGLPPETSDRDVVAASASSNGNRAAIVAPRRRWRRRDRVQAAPRDRAVLWLRNAMIALGALAIAAAVVSFAAQFHMVYAYRGQRAI